MNRSELIALIRQRRSFLCIGLDTEPSRIPPCLKGHPDPVLAFNRHIIDATRDLAVAYKPNTAFYEAMGPSGWHTLAETAVHIGTSHFRIADAKRGDIGNTSRQYAEAFFRRLPFDAVTIAPYMGHDSVAPFLGFEGHWAILLGLTSNEGSADFQFAGDPPLYQQVLERASRWGNPEQLMFVVGATHPEAFRAVRRLVPEHFLLVPGVGAQGGALESVCQHGMNAECGLLVNSSRAILYASSGSDFAERAREEALKVQQQMDRILTQHNL
jgi:orotidine-5'-phosphate decarboxylase